MEYYMIRRIILGLGNFEQERFIWNKILHTSAAESRDGNGGRDDSEELGTHVGGSKTPT